jgi:putative NIF3 family GTP cyclohydrolase 1 type 2
MTAQDVVTRIQQKLAGDGIAWRGATVDTFKAGKPDAPVRGIATTGMATLDVLRRAAAAQRNFVITHEPTYYNHQDQTAALEHDTTYQAKLRFIEEHGLTVWRFHDHAHMMRPDPLVAGSARTLGLAQYASQSERGVYVVPETTLRALAGDIARRLGAHAIRVAGDPDMKVARISMGPGYGVPALTQAIDVSIGGEAPESGGHAEYALDAQALGRPRGVILLGHMMSEDWGMREVAEWLRGVVTEVPIDWIPAGEPFGAPRA